MSVPSPAAVAPQAFKHGNHIFVYSNIRTSQIIYSLTRSLKNNLSLKQLPFLGKKSVPAALRKDLWQPLCLLEFPSSTQGLSAYHKLREYRRLHETSYSLDTVTQKTGPLKGQLLPKKKRGKVLMNQKANSVADMAAVLLLQARKPTEEELRKAERKVRTDGRPLAKRGLGRQANAEAFTSRGSVEGVRIRWANILDAEYAETWPQAVLHDDLEQSRYTAAWPEAPPLTAEGGVYDDQAYLESRASDIMDFGPVKRSAESLQMAVPLPQPSHSTDIAT